jgi:hypothetical protein
MGKKYLNKKILIKKYKIKDYVKDEYNKNQKYHSSENKKKDDFFLNEPKKIDNNTWDFHGVNKNNLHKWIKSHVFYKKNFNMCNLILGKGHHSKDGNSVLKPFVELLVKNINKRYSKNDNKLIVRFNIIDFCNHSGYTIYKTSKKNIPLAKSFKEYPKLTNVEKSEEKVKSIIKFEKCLITDVKTIVEKRKYKKGNERASFTDIFYCKHGCNFCGNHSDVYDHENYTCKMINFSKKNSA